MIRDLLHALKTQGYEHTTLDGGIIVTLPNVTIAVGHDKDTQTLMTHTQEDLEEGPSFSAAENLTQSDVLEHCAKYRKKSIASTPVATSPVAA